MVIVKSFNEAYKNTRRLKLNQSAAEYVKVQPAKYIYNIGTKGLVHIVYTTILHK